jgi:hypothetical protein
MPIYACCAGLEATELEALQVRPDSLKSLALSTEAQNPNFRCARGRRLSCAALVLSKSPGITGGVGNLDASEPDWP